MPRVDQADRTNDAVKAQDGSMPVKSRMQAPKAFKADERRSVTRAISPATAMTAARKAETGMPVKTTYPARNNPVATAVDRRPSRNSFSPWATKSVTMDRCAPDTATKWASPVVLNCS